MSTSFLCSQCDNMFAKLLEQYIASVTHGVEQGVRWEGVLITLIICLALGVIADMVKKTILIWIDKTATKPSGNNTPSDKDKNVKYIEKLIDFLQSQTKVYGEKGEFMHYKPFDSPESKMYNEVLACLIESQQNAGKVIDIAKLRKALNLEVTKDSNEQAKFS